MSTDLDQAHILAVDEGRTLRPDAERIVVVGTAEVAVHVAAGFPGADVRVFDDLTAPDAPSPPTVRRLPLGRALIADAALVVGGLPKSLGELDEIAQLVAAYASPDVALVLGGRVKHMTQGMNEQLARSFTDVSASLGRQKSRALRATGPRPTAPRWPQRRFEPSVGFDITAHGGAFAGTKLDIGTRALLDVLPDVAASVHAAGIALDLGCGTGVLATAVARLRPDLHVLASDRSWAATASAAATAAGAGVAVRVTQEDAATTIPEASVDLVLLNPPFHDGHAVQDDMANRLFTAAARVLRPGGALVTVYNSHLRHRAALERLVGRTEQLSRTSKFTLTRSVR